MRIRRAFERRLLSNFQFRIIDLGAGELCLALLALTVAPFISAAAFGQNVQTSESPTNSASPTAISPLLNFDAVRPAATSQASPGTSTSLAAIISAPSSYQLSPNDQIAVEVFGEDDLRTAARLNGDGAVSLPLLGSVRLAGLTLNQAATRLTELYGRDYLVNPKVNVTLIGYAKRRFTVLGQVNRPGSYEMPEGSPSGIDLLEAVAIAGGYTRIAAPERISVKRRDQVMRVDAKRIAHRGGSEGGFLIEPGDTITVGESIF
jgi:protein involved in polysaccharide export with SLBB domain